MQREPGGGRGVFPKEPVGQQEERLLPIDTTWGAGEGYERVLLSSGGQRQPVIRCAEQRVRD